MKLTFNLLDNILSLGTQPHYDPKENQITRSMNMAAIIFIIACIPNTIVVFHFNSTVLTWEVLAAIFLMSSAIYLNSKKHINAARIMTLLVGNLHIFIFTCISGMEGGAQLYFPALIVAPLFMFTPKEYKKTILFVSFSTMLMLVLYLIEPDSANFQIPVELINFLFYFSVICSHIVIFIFVLHFYNESIRLEKSLKVVNKKLLKLSETDSLTQLPNRRSFDANLDREWGKGIRSKQNLAIIMMDVDSFKKYNDFYGHQEGDRCLKYVSKIINDNTREYMDYPGRYGGEEFIIMLPNTDAENAFLIADRIRKDIISLAIPHQLDEKQGIVSCSFGVTSCIPDNNTHHSDIIRIADQALYKAKKNGRNRVEVLV